MTNNHLKHVVKCLLQLGWIETEFPLIFLRQSGKKGYYFSIPRAVSIEIKNGRLIYKKTESGSLVPTINPNKGDQ